MKIIIRYPKHPMVVHNSQTRGWGCVLKQGRIYFFSAVYEDFDDVFIAEELKVGYFTLEDNGTSSLSLDHKAFFGADKGRVGIFQQVLNLFYGIAVDLSVFNGQLARE